jgi:hypothetical protein
MLPPTQRVHYFDHQFLHVDDFTDEQAYHLGMRRAHNRMLHSTGVAYGLTLSAAGTAVKVGAGIALDGEGREIVLPEDDLVPVPAELAGKTGYFILAYGERTIAPTTETGAAGDRRWEEVPVLRMALAAPADTGAELVLGRVTADATRTVTGIDDGDANGRRRVAGPAPINELAVRTLEVAGGRDFAATGGDLKVGTGASMLKVGVVVSGPAAGEARLRAEGTAPRLILGAAGADVLAVQAGGVGIGMGSAAPEATLHVAGGRAFATTDGDLKVGTAANRLKVGVEVSGPAAGTARLRAEGTVPRLVLGAGGADLLTVSGTGVAIATAAAGDAPLTVGGRIRIANASSTVFTGLLFQHDGSDRAFLGLASTNLLSLYAPTYGSPVMRVDLTSGNMGLHTDPAGAGGATLTVNGGLAVTNGRVSDGRLRSQVKKTDPISQTNTGTATNWAAVLDMELSVTVLQKTFFLIHFYLGGVESRGTESVEAHFRLLVDNVEEAFTGETFHVSAWSAHGVTLERLIELAPGTRTVKAEWKVLQPSPAKIIGSHLSSMRTLSVIEL